MAAAESIPENNDLKVFLEAAVDYLRSIDPETGTLALGNREAKQVLNSCKSVIGILPFDDDIPYNISRMKRILDYLDPYIRNNPTLYDLLDRAKSGLKLHHEQSAGLHPMPQNELGTGKVKVEPPLTTKEVLKGRYADFHDIYKKAVESVRSQLQSDVAPAVFEDRINRMDQKIRDEFTGGIDGLKIYFDAKHSELFYASQQGPAEDQKDFLFRVTKIFIGAFARNNFYELYKRISSTALEDVDSFVFRLAKKYTDIKALSPDAVIITYQDGAGTIRLREKPV